MDTPDEQGQPENFTPIDPTKLKNFPAENDTVTTSSSSKKGTILLISMIVVLVLGMATGIYLLNTQSVSKPEKVNGQTVVKLQPTRIPSPTRTLAQPSPTQTLLALEGGTQLLTSTPTATPNLSPTEIIVGQPTEATQEAQETPTEAPQVPAAGTQAGVIFLVLAGALLITLMLVF